jgi:hypothetical protein
MRGMLASIERLCPRGTVSEMLPLLGESLATMIKHGSFITSGWYPLRDYRLLLGAAMQVTGRDTELIEELARDSTIQDFRGIYRLLTFALSPEFLMRRSGGLFARYYDTGTLMISVARKGYAEAHYRGCLGFDRVLWKDVVAGTCTILEVCGARDIRRQVTKGGADGDAELDLVAEWS